MKYFKQYGEQRTGTNYLKSLLEINFKNVTVFASVLGWKHGMYETGNHKERWYMQHLDTPRDKCNSHKEWIKKMTRDGDVYCVDNYKLPFSVKELNHACNNLNYLFMIKDIYAFIYSFKKFRNPKMTWQNILDNGWVISWCNKYEENYRRWIEVHEDNKDTSAFIKYEDLISNINPTLNKLERKFNLKRKYENYTDESKIVDASTDIGLLRQNKEFNKRFYLDRLYMDELPNEVKVVIDEKYNSTNFQVLMTKVSNRLNLP